MFVFWGLKVTVLGFPSVEWKLLACSEFQSSPTHSDAEYADSLKQKMKEILGEENNMFSVSQTNFCLPTKTVLYFKFPSPPPLCFRQRGGAEEEAEAAASL